MRTDGFARAAPAAVVLAATLAGAALRLHHIMAMPFWLDEAYSAYAADHGFGFLWHVVPRYETHPPLYYSLVRLWSLGFGETLAARRWLGLACGIAAIPATALAAHALGRLVAWERARRRWLGALAAALAAAHPQMLLMAQQLRPYPVMILVYALTLTCLFRLAAQARDGVRLDARWLAGFTLGEAAMLWLHTLGPLFAGSLAIALALCTVRRGLPRRDWLALAATQVAAAAIYVPALLIAMAQAPTWIKTTWLRFRPHGLRYDLGLLYATWNIWVSVAAGLAMVAALAMLARARWGGRAGAALVVLAGLPTAASILLSIAVSPVFLTRTLSPVTVPALILTAAGLAWPARARRAGLAAAALFAAAYARTAWGLAERAPNQDWYAALRWLAPRMHPGDTVWAYPNEGALPLGYALKDTRRAMTVVPIPAAVPAFGHGGYFVTGSQGVVSLYPREIAALMTSPAARVTPTIWVLRLGPWKYDPGDRLVRALGATRTVVGHYRQGPIDLTGLRLSHTDRPSPRT